MIKTIPSPKREPLSRLWFLAGDYKKADTHYTKGSVIWLHPKTNDVLNKYGQKLTLQLAPLERHKKTSARYLKLRPQYGDMYLARLKYLTFKGEIRKGETIDHIDGNPLNNDIRNLRAIPDAINRRDGGFLRKLRNSGYNPAMYSPLFILQGFERLAAWKAEHSRHEYDKLRGQALLQVFVGPTFTVVNPDILMDIEPLKHI